MCSKTPPKLEETINVVRKHIGQYTRKPAPVRLLSTGVMMAGGTAIAEGAAMWSGKGDITQGVQNIAGAITDPNSCHNGTAGGGDEMSGAVACGFVQIAEQLAADALIKGGIKQAYKVAFKKSISEMAEKAVTKASQEMAEKMAVKFGEHVVEEVVERETTEAVMEAAVETEMGPVGWALEIFQAISMVLDLGDPEGYNKMLEDNQINEMIGNMELSMKNTFATQSKKTIEHMFATKFSADKMPPGVDQDQLSKMKDCLLCKMTTWPQRKFPFSSDMFDLTLDPVLHQKIIDYQIDYFRWQTGDRGEPAIDPDTGQPDYLKWTPRTLNGDNEPLGAHGPDPESQTKYRTTDGQTPYVNGPVKIMNGKNPTLAGKMQDHKNVFMFAGYGFAGLVVFIVVGVLVGRSE